MGGMRCNSTFSVGTYSIKMFIQANVRAVRSPPDFGWPPPINFLYLCLNAIIFRGGRNRAIRCTVVAQF